VKVEEAPHDELSLLDVRISTTHYFRQIRMPTREREASRWVADDGVCFSGRRIMILQKSMAAVYLVVYAALHCKPYADTKCSGFRWSEPPGAYVNSFAAGGNCSTCRAT
jgi:hypothetical protein